jgi:serine protease Do
VLNPNFAHSTALTVATGPQRLLLALGLGLALALAPAVRANALGAPESFADLAEQSAMVAASTDGGPVVPEGSPFQDFFEDFMNRNGEGGTEPQREQALGSGFVISADGYIVTNNHVIEGADEIEIEFFDKTRLKAKLVGTDTKTDIALLKVEAPSALPFVAFGDSDVMRVGDWVMAMGNPLGQGFSVSAGIISARGRELQGTYDDFLQTDAAINKGNSGGPLFNMEGQVVGVNTAILSPTGGSIGIGFSMASNVVSNVVDQLKEFGETRRGWLGVRIQDVTPDVAEAMGLTVSKGALVTDVPEGPAKDAGLLAGDVITTFNEQEITDVRDLTRTVADSPIGEAVPVLVLREGVETTIQVVLGRRETAEAEAQPAKADEKGTPEAPKEAELLGLKLVPMDDKIAKELGMPAGSTGLAVTHVDPASEAAAKGLMAGDVIVEAGQKAVVRLDDLTARVDEAKEAGRKSLLLLVRREGDPRFVALSIE